jgi:predicted transcriptional regulator
MADDGFTVRIDEDLAESVRVAAAAKGVPVEIFVRDALTVHISADAEGLDDPDPAIDQQILENAIRTGATMPWEDVAPWVRSWGTADESPPPKWRR